MTNKTRAQLYSDQMESYAMARFFLCRILIQSARLSEHPHRTRKNWFIRSNYGLLNPARKKMWALFFNNKTIVKSGGASLPLSQRLLLSGSV